MLEDSLIKAEDENERMQKNYLINVRVFGDKIEKLK